MKTYINIQERLVQLNQNADKRSVLESIDRPIRPLIVEMNRIGIVTRFSCCGYSYDGEEEPKSHTKDPFVIIYNPTSKKIVETIATLPKGLWSKEVVEAMKKPEVAVISRLFEIAVFHGWEIEVMPSGSECVIYYSTWEKVLWVKSDNLPEAIHDYEMKLDSIITLTRALKELPTFKERVTVIDGNISRKKFYGEEWMIEPKQPVMLDFSKETIPA